MRKKSLMMNILKKTFFFVVAPFFLLHTGCVSIEEKAEYHPTLIIGHRGSGTTSAEFQENTLASIINAFERLNGAVVDIQCSKDGTIWLYHKAGLPTDDLLCLPHATDKELEELARKIPDFKFTRLEEVLHFMTMMEETPLLSLDVKGYFANGCFEGNNATHEYFQMMAHSLQELLERYPMQANIIVETDYKVFLNLIKENEPQIELYLLGYSNFRERIERAIEKSYQGISFYFGDEYLTREEIELARQNELKVILWTISNEEEFKTALSWHPAFIKTGNVELGEELLNTINQKKKNAL